MQPPLHEYQKRAISWLKGRTASYLAIDMGLGKTRITIEHLVSSPASLPAVVVAPMRVAISTWPSEILKWAPQLSYVVLHGRTKVQDFDLKRDVYIINYEGLEWFKSMIESKGRSKFMRGTLVLDESTMVKAPSSKRTKALVKLRPMFSSAIALSATPAPNGWHDLWSQYFILDYGASLGSKYTAFFNKFFIELPSRRIAPRGSDAATQITKLVSSTTFRLDAEDYLKLPDYIDNQITIDLPAKLRQQYKDLENDFVLSLSETTKVTALTASTLSMKLRQFCQGALYTTEARDYEVLHSLKLDAMEQVVEELNGSPVLVPIQFKFELDQIKKRFGNIPAITGGLAASESRRIIDEWNTGGIPVLVCHPASISHGVNLQAGGHNILWLALTWNYEHYTQLNGRLRRQGQKNTVVRTQVLIGNSIEQRISRALNSKGANQQTLLDALKGFVS